MLCYDIEQFCKIKNDLVKYEDALYYKAIKIKNSKKSKEQI